MTTAGTSTRSARAAAAARFVVLCLIALMLAAIVPRAARAADTEGYCRIESSAECKESKARSLLAQGDAQIAANERDPNRRAEALRRWQEAVDIGLGSGAQASLIAQKRIQMYTLTCLFVDEKDEAAVIGHPLITVVAQQQALMVLGYYLEPDKLDGVLSPKTRSAIRRFQRDMAWDDTGELKPRQIVYLICNGAETARDHVTQTKLATMYVAGVGVKRHLGYARKFLMDASPRNPRATFLLSVLHGTGHCDFPLDLDRADLFLKEAADQGHPYAKKFWQQYGPPMPQATRWQKIASESVVIELLASMGIPCPRPSAGQSAQDTTTPNPSPIPRPDPAPVTTAKRLVYQVQSVNVRVFERNPPVASITVRGTARSGGWRNIELRPLQTFEPEIGMRSYTLVGTPPSGPATQALVPVTATVQLNPLPPDVKTIRVLAEANELSQTFR